MKLLRSKSNTKIQFQLFIFNIYFKIVLQQIIFSQQFYNKTYIVNYYSLSLIFFFEFITDITLLLLSIINSLRPNFYCKVIVRDGNGAGRVRKIGSSPPPHMVFSYPIPVPWGPVKPYPIKLYFLLICS